MLELRIQELKKLNRWELEEGSINCGKNTNLSKTNKAYLYLRGLKDKST